MKTTPNTLQDSKTLYWKSSVDLDIGDPVAGSQTRTVGVCVVFY
jgi:hypothetical protein